MTGSSVQERNERTPLLAARPLAALLTETLIVLISFADRSRMAASTRLSYLMRYTGQGADGRLELKMDRYLDSFPFDMFVVLRDVEALPEVLSSTLRQFFEKVSSDR
ncbi:hypothetical protein BCR35DRAFT_329248 [Leucosporidium creatinivorum]|uniref:Uncharacterized protein n=1 Tax=Leucosporidium creatinivorum TaxID=106004 RepID=A0A1Y2G0D4_9BASI|nr:hypothetical protein BCR35DRAFT_329248 [Leucosporidium creatinivorum]